MLSLVLQEIAQSNYPVSLADLSRKLEIERGALEGMLAYWVRKGRLRDADGPVESGCGSNGANSISGVCGSTCTGVTNCAFVARMPKMYSLAQPPKAGARPGRDDVLEPKKG